MRRQPMSPTHGRSEPAAIAQNGTDTYRGDFASLNWKPGCCRMAWVSGWRLQGRLDQPVRKPLLQAKALRS